MRGLEGIQLKESGQTERGTWVVKGVGLKIKGIALQIKQNYANQYPQNLQMP
jgi:hypothetical protein